MKARKNHEMEVLREGLAGQRPADELVLASAVVLSERLESLKRSSPLFEAVSFSPEVEAMMAEQLVAAAG